MINQPIDRRTFLRGAGTVMALPLLEAMMPLSALAASPDVPVADFFKAPGEKGAVPDEINPIAYLAKVYNFDRSSLKPAVVIKDERHEYNIKRASGDDGSAGASSSRLGRPV